MLPLRQSLAVPIRTGYVAQISTGPQFGHGPFGMRGLRGLANCGCSPTKGCGCGTSGMSGFSGIGPPSLTGIVGEFFDWLGGMTQKALPPSASVPPQYGSTGNISTTVQDLIPWAIGAWLVYKVLK